MRIARGPLAIVLIVVAAITSTPASAGASSSLLCQGFTQCEKRGYTHDGYRGVQKQSFWNMKSGTNCTNYVAYRVTKDRLVARPPGTNDASTWGAAARAAGVTVTSKPRVGDVAWWKANAGKSGKKGHVAIVERVRKDGSIVVSEDNMNKTFAWRSVRKGSSWPSGFVRYPTSDGSPSGRLDGTSAGDGTVSVRATASEPDRWAHPVTYLVTVGAPRGEDPVESFTFTTSYYSMQWTRSVKAQGKHTVYLYGLNTPGTKGEDRLLGRGTVTIR